MEDLLGKNFGRLTVVEYVGKNKHRMPLWRCKCECGGETITNTRHLKIGKTKSCGCFQKDRVRQTQTTHNLSDSKLYSIWGRMRMACNNPQNCKYYKYGARGIKVCKQWDNLENGFQNFYKWCIENGYKDIPNEKGRNKLSIDRIDNNGDYCPENCRWVDATTQQNNTRRNHFITYNGETKSLAQWSKEYNISPNTLHHRICRSKWDIEKALTTPPKRH